MASEGKHTASKRKFTFDKNLILAIIVAAVAVAASVAIVIAVFGPHEEAEKPSGGDIRENEGETIPGGDEKEPEKTPENPDEGETGEDQGDNETTGEENDPEDETDTGEENTPAEEENPPEEEDPGEETDQGETEEYTGYYHPMTGEKTETDQSRVRPVAVMIENLKSATPQDGIASADIVYETLVEGGITRLLGIYSDVTLAEDIGPVRSTRPYYASIARAYDAIMVTAGASDDGYIAMKTKGMDFIDGVNGGSEQTALFYRDSWRKANTRIEHSLMLSSGKLSGYIYANDIRARHASGYSQKMQFADSVTPAIKASEEIEITFRSTKTTTFTYDAETKLYSARQFGTEITDKLDGSEVHFRNVIAIFTRMTTYDDEGRLNVDLTTGGKGYFFCEGRYEPISWSRKNDDAPFVFKDGDGKEITFARGSTYVAIVPSNGKVNFE